MNLCTQIIKFTSTIVFSFQITNKANLKSVEIFSIFINVHILEKFMTRRAPAAVWNNEWKTSYNILFGLPHWPLPKCEWLWEIFRELLQRITLWFSGATLNTQGIQRKKWWNIWHSRSKFILLCPLVKKAFERLKISCNFGTQRWKNFPEKRSQMVCQMKKKLHGISLPLYEGNNDLQTTHIMHANA